MGSLYRHFIMANAPNLALATFPSPSTRETSAELACRPSLANCFRPRSPTFRKWERHARRRNIRRQSVCGATRARRHRTGPASERGHVHGIFPFDVEIRVNRFFDRNSRSIGASRSHPPTPIPKLSPGARGMTRNEDDYLSAHRGEAGNK